jgi:hypothetical protein
MDLFQGIGIPKDAGFGVKKYAQNILLQPYIIGTSSHELDRRRISCLALCKN